MARGGWSWDRGGGDGTGRRGDSRDDGLFHNSLIRTLKRHLQDILVCGNVLISFLSFGNFWPGQEDQREANEMAEGRGKVTTFFFIVSQHHSTLHKALSNITPRVCFLSPGTVWWKDTINPSGPHT